MLANKFARLHFILIVLCLAMAEAAHAQPLPATAPPAATWVFPPGIPDLTIPARFSSTGEIAIRMTVNGRGLDLTLDTGMDRDMLDSSVFTALALHQTDDSTATIDTVRFGGATMRGLAINKGSFFRRDENGNLIVGVLGYDFLKAAVVKIDYDHQQIHIINPVAFHPPQPAMVYSLYPEDRIPLVSASVGGATGGSFVIDTGATAFAVFPRLVLGNPHAFTSYQELSHDTQVSYYRFFWPLCGHVEMTPYSVDQVRVENVGVKNWVVWSVPPSSCFATKRLDGLIGYDFLRLFNVYIDYPGNLVILEPNAVYKNAPNAIKL